MLISSIFTPTRHLLHLFFFALDTPPCQLHGDKEDFQHKSIFLFLNKYSFAWTSFLHNTPSFLMSILYSNKQTHVFQHFWGNIGWNNANKKRSFQNDIVKYMLFDFAEVSNKVSFLNFSLVLVVNMYRIKKQLQD